VCRPAKKLDKPASAHNDEFFDFAWGKHDHE
jgi:hypothetical protein